MPTNFYMFFITALIPMLIGAVYYHPKVMGTAWMNSNGFTIESLQGANMKLILGLCYVFSLLLSTMLSSFVIHQSNVASLFVPEIADKSSQEFAYLVDFMTKYGDKHRTWSHGAVHGGIITLFFIMPILAINALFERRSWKYVAIHVGYWFITLVVIGAILCSTLVYEMPK